jgi:hypothetical protein
VNKARGIINAAALGMTKTQSAVEGALFFAPRYMRAYMGLISDAMQGGMRGNRARYFLGRGLAGLVSGYCLTGLILGQEPNFDFTSGKAFTYELGGAHVSPFGGGYYNVFRLTAATSEQIKRGVQHPETASEIMDIDHNPIAKKVWGVSSPAMSLLISDLLGRNYLGEKLNDPAALLKNTLIRGLPFSLQSLIEEGPVSAGVTFIGGRAYPVQSWEWADYHREIGAKALFDAKWDDLNVKQQRDVYENTPAGKQARHYSQKAIAESAAKGRPSGVREKLYADFRGEKALQFADAIIAVHEGKKSMRELADVRAGIGKELMLKRQDLEKQYPDERYEWEKQKPFLEDAYADLYLFMDADENGDGTVSDTEWETFRAKRHQLVDDAAAHGVEDLKSYALERAGVFWGNPVLDSYEKQYQEAKTQRDEFYEIPHWTGLGYKDSDKVDQYRRYIITYTEELRRAALKNGYSLETTLGITEAIAREILIQNPPQGLTTREQTLFNLALLLSSNTDLRRELESPNRFNFLQAHPQLPQWFPQTAVGLSNAEALGLPQYGDSATEILAQTRVATDMEAMARFQQVMEEAKRKIKEH